MKIKTKGNRILIIGLTALALCVAALLFVHFFSAFSFSQQIRGEENLAPSLRHLMGTDYIGRDMLARVVLGAFISLSIALAACAINITIGVAYGAFSGYFGGFADTVLMRLLDVISSIPDTLYVILLMVFFNDGFIGGVPVSRLLHDSFGLASVYIALGLVGWVSLARILRNKVLSLKEMNYVVYAKTTGASNIKIVYRHILPNIMPLILTTITLKLPSAIFFEAFLSFIGLGVKAPAPSLGSLISLGMGSIRSAPYLFIFPMLVLVIFVIIFNLIADGLKKYLSNESVY